MTSYRDAVFNLTPGDARRWRLARQAMMDGYHLDKPLTDLNHVTVKPVRELMNADLDAIDNETTPLAYLGFAVVTAAYGGFHLLAWNARFPSVPEVMLWRISAILIAYPGVFLILFFILQRLVRMFTGALSLCISLVLDKKSPTPENENDHGAEEKTPTKLPEPISVVLMWLAIFAVFIYIFACAYLVYESFRTLFFLPPEAYLATNWTQYLPHVT